MNSNAWLISDIGAFSYKGTGGSAGVWFQARHDIWRVPLGRKPQLRLREDQ
jgi:hypothetical protein